jgi:hypothetical protein
MRRWPWSMTRSRNGSMADGLKLMRLLAEAHMALRAAREESRGDVQDADGDLRVTCEDGQEHTRVMIFGPVRTWRAAYRRRGRRTCIRRTRS